jgi:hypothetical protein
MILSGNSMSSSEPNETNQLLPTSSENVDEKVIRLLQKMVDEIENNILDLFRIVR